MRPRGLKPSRDRVKADYTQPNTRVGVAIQWLSYRKHTTLFIHRCPLDFRRALLLAPGPWSPAALHGKGGACYLRACLDMLVLIMHCNP